MTDEETAEWLNRYVEAGYNGRSERGETPPELWHETVAGKCELYGEMLRELRAAVEHARDHE